MNPEPLNPERLPFNEDHEILKNDHKDKTKKGANIETGDYERCGLVSIGRAAELDRLSERDMIRHRGIIWIFEFAIEAIFHKPDCIVL